MWFEHSNKSFIDGRHASAKIHPLQITDDYTRTKWTQRKKILCYRNEIVTMVSLLFPFAADIATARHPMPIFSQFASSNNRVVGV